MPRQDDEVRECEVCAKVARVWVSALPGIPMSVARCLECVSADAVPIWVAVATTADIGGMENAADWWREAVLDTLAHLGISQEDFDTLVSHAQDRHDGEFIS